MISNEKNAFKNHAWIKKKDYFTKVFVKSKKKQCVKVFLQKMHFIEDYYSFYNVIKIN